MFNWVPIIRVFCICVNKNVRIRGYFSKPQVVREQKGLGNNIFLYSCGLLKPLSSSTMAGNTVVVCGSSFVITSWHTRLKLSIVEALLCLRTLTKHC
jgi:hypothetical protein